MNSRITLRALSPLAVFSIRCAADHEYEVDGRKYRAWTNPETGQSIDLNSSEPMPAVVDRARPDMNGTYDRPRESKASLTIRLNQ